MGLIAPEGKLVAYGTLADGMVTSYGFSRDWRLDDRWQLQHCEYIEPLKAIAPVGDVRPRTMPFTQWDKAPAFNQKLREVKVSGNPTRKWIEFYDTTFYPASTSLADFCGMLTAGSWADGILPRFALHLVRFAPPTDPLAVGYTEAREGAIPQVVVELESKQRQANGEWLDGMVRLYLPMAGTNRSTTALHHLLDRDAPDTPASDLFTYGDFISSGPAASALHEGVLRETWVFEYEELWWSTAGGMASEAGDGRTFQGSHILIRRVGEMGSWWHHHDPHLRLLPGGWRLLVGGARTYLNFTPIRYGTNDGLAVAPWNLSLPAAAGSAWTSDVTWGGIASTAEGWDAPTVDDATMQKGTWVETDPGPPEVPGHTEWSTVLRPRFWPAITFHLSGNAGQYKRPIAWFVTEEHEPTIGGATGSTVTDTTDGDGRLVRLNYTQRNDWRGATGEAEFEFSRAASDSLPYPAPEWSENAKLEIYMGWAGGTSAGIQSQKVATGYILGGGKTYSRSGTEGGGRTVLSMRFGDFSATRMAHKDVLDFRQAGGRTVSAWAYAVANRMGLADSMVDVAASVASLVIPLCSLPSEDAFAPGDGSSWASHLDSVCRAMGLRWGFDKDGTGRFFVDGGATAWVSGSTPDFVLDDDALADGSNVLWKVEHHADADEWRNAVKSVVGRPPRVQVHYASDTTAVRAAGVGDDFWKVLREDDAEEAAALYQEFWEHSRRYTNVIVWETLLRPDLRPGMFVQVNTVPNMGLGDEWVFQIIEHRMAVEASEGGGEGTSTFVGVVVSSL